MSFFEYEDLFIGAQSKNCPYRAFMFDVVNSRNCKDYLQNKDVFLSLVKEVYFLLEKEENKTKSEILLRGSYNIKNVTGEFSGLGNLCNPIVLGDSVTFFVYNEAIKPERMIEIFLSGLKKNDIKYLFHFATGVYETNNYNDGNKKLFKGYMPQLLEMLSKNSSVVLNSIENNEELC